MSYRLVIAEKPSVGAAYAKVLGATNRQDGYWEGNGYLVSWCMNRYVRRGSKGIALLDTSGDAPRLRYVFDVADTGELSQSRSLNLWKLSEENAQAVSLSLENGYDVPAREGLERQLRAISSQLAGACWVDRKQEIFDIVDGSFLEGYDEGAIGASFRRAASVSLEYALRSRCGLANEGRFIREDFIPVTEWNTPEAAAALGTAVSEMSGEVLRTIEISIRNHERSLSHDYLPAERRDPDSRPEAERNGGAAPGQVRADAQDVPANASDDAVEQPAAKRDIAGAPAGDRRGGTEPSGTADAGADEGRGRDGGIESQRPDAMGRPDERLQGAGRGNHPQGAGVQLSFLEGLAAQPGTERAESDMPSALSIPQEVVDEVLRVGGNTAHQRERIVAAFEKQKPDTPDFLRSLLHGGNGIVTDAGTFAVWYDETGIRISRGRSARHAPSARLVSWQEAAGRIGQLLEEGWFAANVELAGAEELTAHAIHPYTRSLLSAIPMPDPRRERQKKLLVYDPAMHDYSREAPQWRELRPEHFVLCSAAEAEQWLPR